MDIYVDDVELTGLNFNIIGDYRIIDPDLFAYYNQEGFFELRVYTIGNFFRVWSPN